MSPTERIAQTFPDINSQAGNTSGTAAGVRSFPQPFIGVTAGVSVVIQTGSITLGVGVTSGSDVLATSVDSTKSFIQYRGVTVAASTLIINNWRNRWFFSGLVGVTASSVSVERPRSDVSITVYYTVVAFTGGGGVSADIRIERCFCNVNQSSTSCFCVVPGATLTNAELARAFIFSRGAEVRSIGGGAGPLPDKQPERWHGSIRVHNVGGVTRATFSRFTPGSGSPGGELGANCGFTNNDVYFTVVIFP